MYEDYDDTFCVISTTDDGERFEKRLLAKGKESVIEEARRLSYEATGCQTVDVYDPNGYEIATMIDLD